MLRVKYANKYEVLNKKKIDLKKKFNLVNISKRPSRVQAAVHKSNTLI